MIVATRIATLTEQMRRATLRVAETRAATGRDRRLIDELERRGYRVTRPEQTA